MKISTIAVISAFLASPALADERTLDERLQQPIQVLTSDGGTVALPVNTRDRLGDGEGIDAPVYTSE